jgi:hypothetical protein
MRIKFPFLRLKENGIGGINFRFGLPFPPIGGKGKGWARDGWRNTIPQTVCINAHNRRFLEIPFFLNHSTSFLLSKLERRKTGLAR